MTPRFTLDYGVRWDLYTPITERAHRTGGFVAIEWRAAVRHQSAARLPDQLEGVGAARAGCVAGHRQAFCACRRRHHDDSAQHLAGQFSHRLHSVCRLSAPALGSNAPIHYGFQITPSQLPPTYTPSGQNIFASGKTKPVAPNTVMDVDRYEKDVAALTPGGVVSALNLSGIDRSFGNATLYTWTAGLERKFGNLTADAGYVGTAAEKLPRTSFPNAYPGADPAFAPYTQFDSAGNVIGGFGRENVITATAHSTYHALQTSLSGTVGHGGPGIQASYTWSKSIDDTSQVVGGTGSTAPFHPGSRRIRSIRIPKKARRPST